MTESKLVQTDQRFRESQGRDDYYDRHAEGFDFAALCGLAFAIVLGLLLWYGFIVLTINAMH